MLPEVSFPEYMCQMYMSRNQISDMVLIQFFILHGLHISNCLYIYEEEVNSQCREPFIDEFQY
jgi:hypothetical protein